MSSFDPETGARIPTVPQATPRPPVNPWHRALTAAWGGALLLAAVLAASAFVLTYPGAMTGPAGEATAAALLSAAGWFLTIAVVAGVAQLAALAATWRAPAG